MAFINGFILGLATGVWLVGLFAPWLVADTAMKLEEEMAELEEKKAEQKRNKDEN